MHNVNLGRLTSLYSVIFRDKKHMFLLCSVMFRPSISAAAPALPLTAAVGQLGLQTGLISC